MLPRGSGFLRAALTSLLAIAVACSGGDDPGDSSPDGGDAADAAEPMSRVRFTLVGGNTNAGGGIDLHSQAPVPQFGALGASIGQSEALGLIAATSPGSPGLAAGFWFVEGEGFLLGDVDGDGISDVADNFSALANPGQENLDGDGAGDIRRKDDDVDGLADRVETDTEVFVSATDIGTDPRYAGTDGDGLDDAAEVVAGSDPNDPLDPPPPTVPALGWPGLAALGLMLLGAAVPAPPWSRSSLEKGRGGRSAA